MSTLLRVLICGLPLLYVAAFALQLVHFLKGHRVTRVAALAVLLFGGALHLTLLVGLGTLHGHMPLTTVWEALTTIAFALVLIDVYLQLRSGTANLGVFLVGTIALFQVIAGFKLEPLPTTNPELVGFWFAAHSFTAIAGYSSFAVSGLLAALYLLQRRQIRGRQLGFIHSRLPALGTLDQLCAHAAVIGFALLTVGLATGAVFANQVWGEWWSWDPKQTSALVVWGVYAAFIFCRAVLGWKGGRSAVLSLVGLATLIFSFVGVHLVFTSMHAFY